jgi:acetoin utilization deacetylase AcuC-like enzyme
LRIADEFLERHPGDRLDEFEKGRQKRQEQFPPGEVCIEGRYIMSMTTADAALAQILGWVTAMMPANNGADRTGAPLRGSPVGHP